MLVAPNFVGPGDPDFKKQGVSITQQEYLDISTRIALKWARIAEKYKVEFFAPQNELDVILDINFADGKEDAVIIASDWHRKILPKLKKEFSGKVMAKMDDCFSGVDVRGYDYVGITISHERRGLGQFREGITQEYLELSQAATKSKCKWLISEAWMPYGGPFYSDRTNRKGESLDQLQDEYFRIATEEYLRFKRNRPSGFIFIAWIMPGEQVKDRPAEKVLKKFLIKLQ